MIEHLYLEPYLYLSYCDSEEDGIDVFADEQYVGYVKVFTDRENDNREYICVNEEIIYLDTLAKENL